MCVDRQQGREIPAEADERMDQRGLRDREEFIGDLGALLERQGIASIGVAYVTEDGYADYEGLKRSGAELERTKMLQAIEELAQYCEESADS